ncbi:MAG: hypothetical protein WAW36_01105 [Methylovulum miyakonense]|uniref:hypothetical protein n=1 Tax=Methylovulum miyakonense TaxID=645578 RepID=UPI003BB5A5DE
MKEEAHFDSGISPDLLDAMKIIRQNKIATNANHEKDWGQSGQAYKTPLPRPCRDGCDRIGLQYQVNQLKVQVANCYFQLDVTRYKLANTRIALVATLVISLVGVCGMWAYLWGGL